MKPDEILRKYFGYTLFRGKQEAIIRCALEGRHALVLMPTGMGKSICFQIPALIMPGLAVVISPLIALMKDQVDGLRKKKIHATFINSSLSRADREQRLSRLADGEYDILYVTPERFRKPAFVKLITRRKVSLLAVDEAHCISEWGHDFRPDYTRLKEFRSLLGNPVTMALTATATPAVQQDILLQLGLPPEEVSIFNEGIERPNLQLKVESVSGDDEKLACILEQTKRLPGNMIVYFSLIKTLELFSDRLTALKIDHLRYHGKLDASQRRSVQNRFMAGDNGLILATNAFGMGVDKANIRCVIHAETPGSMESYYQEIGRAGRDEVISECILLYDEHDLLIQMDFIEWNNPGLDFLRRLHQLLEEEPEPANSFGLDWIKEHMVYKNRFDFRLETALSLFDRYGVTEGEIDRFNLEVVAPLPPQLSAERIAEKILADRRKLHAVVLYIKETGCRKAYIHDYFGVPHEERCHACDLCLAQLSHD
ncbi:MAG: RecQ family ATP-dependent DNA helicase [Planctomycetota bacterium]